jgi:hypothetical protein
MKDTQHQIIGLLLIWKICKHLQEAVPWGLVGEGVTTKTLNPDNQLSGQVSNHAPPKYTRRHYHYTNLFGTTRIQLKSEPGIFQ